MMLCDSQQSAKRPKRKQVKNACVNCQKACKKCDDGRPCQRCIKLGITATCVNSPRKERQKGVKRGPYKKRQHTRQVSQSTNDHSDEGEVPLHLPPSTNYLHTTPIGDHSWNPSAWLYDDPSLTHPLSQPDMTSPMYPMSYQKYTYSPPYLEQHPPSPPVMNYVGQVMPQQPFYARHMQHTQQMPQVEQPSYYFYPQNNMQPVAAEQQPNVIGSWRSFLSTA